MDGEPVHDSEALTESLVISMLANEHVCVDGSIVADDTVPVSSNEHRDAWCSRCGERLLLPGFAGGPPDSDLLDEIEMDLL